MENEHYLSGNTLVPSPLYSGERVRVRGERQIAQLADRPLTPALSPDYRGEGEIRSATGTARRTPPTTRSKSSGIILLGLYALIVALYLCSTANAKPTQQDVFKSIEDNVSESDGSGMKVLLLAMAGVGLLVLVAMFSRRQQRPPAPKSLRSTGKLLKEVRRRVPLKSSEIKQLKAVAEQTSRGDGEPLSSPLVLLLCPSVLAKSAQDPDSRADRKTISQVLRKLARK